MQMMKCPVSRILLVKCDNGVQKHQYGNDVLFWWQAEVLLSVDAGGCAFEWACGD